MPFRCTIILLLVDVGFSLKNFARVNKLYCLRSTL